MKLGPRSVELNKFLAFLQFFFQANYRVVLTSAVKKNLGLFVNIPNSFSCIFFSKCARGADCCKQKIIFERIFIDKNSALSKLQSLLKRRSKFKMHVWKISFIYNQKVPATEELDSTNVIEDALVIMISPTMIPSQDIQKYLDISCNQCKWSNADLTIPIHQETVMTSK